MLITDIIPIITGIVMVIAGYFQMKGNIYVAVGTYLIVDILWFINYIMVMNVFAIITLFLGTLMAAICFYKMLSNEYRKRIDE